MKISHLRVNCETFYQYTLTSTTATLWLCGYSLLPTTKQTHSPIPKPYFFLNFPNHLHVTNHRNHQIWFGKKFTLNQLTVITTTKYNHKSQPSVVLKIELDPQDAIESWQLNIITKTKYEWWMGGGRWVWGWGHTSS